MLDARRPLSYGTAPLPTGLRVSWSHEDRWSAVMERVRTTGHTWVPVLWYMYDRDATLSDNRARWAMMRAFDAWTQEHFTECVDTSAELVATTDNGAHLINYLLSAHPSYIEFLNAWILSLTCYRAAYHVVHKEHRALLRDPPGRERTFLSLILYYDHATTEKRALEASGDTRSPGAGPATPKLAPRLRPTGQPRFDDEPVAVTLMRATTTLTPIAEDDDDEDVSDPPTDEPSDTQEQAFVL